MWTLFKNGAAFRSGPGYSEAYLRDLAGIGSKHYPEDEWEVRWVEETA
jgi:hypothetical protein